MAEILKGAPVAAALSEELIRRAAALRGAGILPTLAILRVGERPDDVAYENAAVKRCEKVGVSVRRVLLPHSCAREALLDAVARINDDPTIHGCLLFRPLPDRESEAAACALPSVLVAGSCAAEDAADGETGFLIEENAPSMAEKLRGLLDRPDRIKTVGENAQRELYLSWEDAVANAWLGYQTVIDNYKRGLYQREKTGADEAFHGLGSLMDRMGKLDLRKTVEIRGKSLSLAEVSRLMHKILEQGEESLRQRYDRFL